MRKFLIATHGSFAKGIKSSLDIIIGETENVSLIEAYIGENKSIEEELKKVLDDLRQEDELVIFSDLLGGSVTNQILQQALQENIHIVSGFNLPLLLDILLSDADSPVTEIIENGIHNAKDQIVYVNKLITSKNQENQND
jgi:mannose/fructose/sorbose-specific phosphotransferase system IIA component